MGVCGCGKTTIGTALASEYSIAFEDADDYHPQSNIEKMKSGTPLTDEDREPWYGALRARLIKAHQENAPFVLACSALKEIYRKQMEFEGCRYAYIYLKGDYETLKERLNSRQNHFMPTTLLDSQLATLEVPTDAITVDIKLAIQDIIERIRSSIDATG